MANPVPVCIETSVKIAFRKCSILASPASHTNANNTKLDPIARVMR